MTVDVGPLPSVDDRRVGRRVLSSTARAWQGAPLPDEPKPAFRVRIAAVDAPDVVFVRTSGRGSFSWGARSVPLPEAMSSDAAALARRGTVVAMPPRAAMLRRLQPPTIAEALSPSSPLTISAPGSPSPAVSDPPARGGSSAENSRTFSCVRSCARPCCVGELTRSRRSDGTTFSSERVQTRVLFEGAWPPVTLSARPSACLGLRRRGAILCRRACASCRRAG